MARRPARQSPNWYYCCQHRHRRRSISSPPDRQRDCHCGPCCSPRCWTPFTNGRSWLRRRHGQRTAAQAIDLPFRAGVAVDGPARSDHSVIEAPFHSSCRSRVRPSEKTFVPPPTTTGQIPSDTTSTGPRPRHSWPRQGPDGGVPRRLGPLHGLPDQDGFQRRPACGDVLECRKTRLRQRRPPTDGRTAETIVRHRWRYNRR